MTRGEAEVLIELDRATPSAENAAAKGAAYALVFPRRSESRWLAAHYSGEREFSDGVVRLLRFIRENAAATNSPSDPLFERAGI